MRGKNPKAYDSIVCIYYASMAVDGIHLRIGTEIPRHEMENAWGKHVITVEVSQYLPCRQIEPLSNRLALPLVSFGDEMGEPVTVSLKHLHGLVSRSSVDKDILQI